MDYTFMGTPGPWHVKMAHGTVPSETGINGEFHSMSGNVKHGSAAIANVLGIKHTKDFSGWAPYEEAEPNAHLISAAPDLLQASISVLKWIEDIGLESTESRDLKSAIQKALNIQP